MKKACLLTTIFLLLVCASSCSKSYQKNIDEIYVYHSAFGQTYPEYKIDLANKTFWEYTSNFSDYVERDESLENEGFIFVSDLDTEKIDLFLRESARYGLTRWKPSYVKENILDGHQWGMTITYADSTQSSIYGSNKYPDTWDKMLKAFEDLTGENILIYNSDWLK